MLYRKNTPPAERVLRVLFGALMIAAGPLWLGGWTVWTLLLAASGVVSVLTGWLGFCPACAMVGRKPLA